MASFREERATQKKLDILRTAANLFNKKGYHETTIEDISNELRMTKGAIYYYVSSKEDLLFQCHDLVASECIEELQVIVESNDHPSKKLKNAIKSLVLFIIEENAVFSVINRTNMLSPDTRKAVLEQRDKYEKLFQSIIEEGVQKGVFETNNVKLARLLILGAVNYMPYWIKPRDNQSNDEIADFFSCSLLKSVIK
ncbi:TetR/AcrR family transcriptional regulator [Neobacillus sp.]|uniref:TetR/AcrR family transcriptional regulator n=1 Tax=Neobacillus sp. TaxID=2675273 RepID=UPI0028962FBF|nr:TetR/AcrR family transcriptional regulator [Neobacillus sp.]